MEYFLTFDPIVLVLKVNHKIQIANLASRIDRAQYYLQALPDAPPHCFPK